VTECSAGDVVPTSSSGVARCVSGDRGFSHLSLVISSDTLNDFAEQWVGQPLEAPVEFQLRPLSPELAVEWNNAARCLRLMASMNHPPDTAVQAMLEHMLKLLVTRHPNNHSELLTYERYAQERTVSIAIGMIRREPMQWRTLSAVAHNLRCPMRDLENGILRLTGQRWAELYREARLDGVKRALTKGSDRFIATLREYGFNLSGRFMRAYEKRFGELPSATYRKNPSAVDVIHSSPSIADALCKRTINEFIDASAGKTIMLSDLAQFIEMSEHATIAAFKQQLARTPMRYVIERRLTRANWLLQNTSLSILAIALECGFGSQSYMTTLIKRHYGVTPRQMRLAGRAVHRVTEA
jgi:transcriptional regulator GlxA family with amidase domain